MGGLVDMPVSPVMVLIMLVVISGLYLYITNRQGRYVAEDEIKNAIVQTMKIPEDNQIPLETLVLISAAVATVMQTQNKYRVTTIKRTDISPNWKSLCKYEQMQTNK